MVKKIKLLYILPLGTVGGAEKFVLSLCQKHDRQRFEVIVCVLFSTGPVAWQIKESGCRVIHLNMRGGFDFINASRLISIIKKNQIDIVNIHGQNPLAKFFALISSAKLVIHTDHGVTIGSSLKRKGRVVFFNRLLGPYIDHFIAISEGMRKSLRVREWAPDHKITLIYNGIELENTRFINKEEIKKSLGIDLKTPVLGMVGRLVPEKKYNLLLESLAHLKKDGINFAGLIIGDGYENQELKKLSMDLGLENSVYFLGERNDVKELLSVMDIFVFSSPGEAFSITLLEAMAAALPIVAFNVEGVSEAVVEGQTGFLVPFGDTSAFADKVNFLLNNRELMQKMGNEAYKRVSEIFNLDLTIKKTENLYEELLRKK